MSLIYPPDEFGDPLDDILLPIDEGIDPDDLDDFDDDNEFWDD